GLVTQMGNQGHSFDDARTAVEHVWAGSIGEVREVHVWTNRPLGYWPQGIPRPEPLNKPAEKLGWKGSDVNARLANALVGKFPAPGPKPAVKMTWYDGGLVPPKPAEIGEEELNKGGGALLIGSKGKLLHDTYGKKPRLLPQSLAESVGAPPQKLPRIADEAHE